MRPMHSAPRRNQRPKALAPASLHCLIAQQVIYYVPVETHLIKRPWRGPRAACGPRVKCAPVVRRIPPPHWLERSTPDDVLTRVSDGTESSNNVASQWKRADRSSVYRTKGGKLRYAAVQHKRFIIEEGRFLSKCGMLFIKARGKRLFQSCRLSHGYAYHEDSPEVASNTCLLLRLCTQFLCLFSFRRN